MTGKTISQNLNLKPVLFTFLLIVFLSSCGEKTTYLPYLGEHTTTEMVVDSAPLQIQEYVEQGYVVIEMELH